VSGARSGELAPLRLPPGTLADPRQVAAHLAALGVTPAAWSNGPGERYGVHEHRTTKLLMCAEGSITFLLDEGVEVALLPGEGFVLPPGTRHGAVVGPHGVTCVEGHLR
jgi:mannose-6-phosphate isomerase-like protein (cupin superfamily)